MSSPTSERTLVLVKPDGVARGLVGEVVARLERKGLRLLVLQLRTLDRVTAERHYAEHEGKPFYADLIDFIISGPLLALVAAGPNAVVAVRGLLGATNPVDATPGSIRGDFALETGRNIVHGSDSAVAAEGEIALFFPELAAPSGPTVT